MKQRHPMFHTGMHAACRHRFIQAVAVGFRPEGNEIAAAKSLYCGVIELILGDRAQCQRVNILCAALCSRVKLPNGLQLIPEKSSLTGISRPGGKISKIPP